MASLLVVCFVLIMASLLVVFCIDSGFITCVDFSGQIVITDRLHAVIMASLLEIPTVFIDNGIGKLSSYINTWMSGVDKITMATNGSDAIRKARSILEKHRHSLPVISTDNA